MEHSSGERQRCVFVLSMKSCGSSILQREIARIGNARLMAKTPHAENETLYWTKAASVLGLPQTRMENSEVPIAPRRAHAMLQDLVRDNAPGFSGPLDTEAGIFAGWTAIVTAQAGMFVEKSPHHLYQPAVVELMERYANQSRSVDACFVGLIRNPTDMLYSSWRRFGIAPEREERHWIRSYTFLRSFHERRPDLVSIVRYEDLVAGTVDVPGLLGVESEAEPPAGEEAFHSSSLEKWRDDPRFGYTPSEEALQLARSYGYSDEEVVNPRARAWWLHRAPRAAAWAAFSRLPLAVQLRIKSSAKMIMGRSN